jgi:hypothetical protein
VTLAAVVWDWVHNPFATDRFHRVLMQMAASDMNNVPDSVELETYRCG